LIEIILREKPAGRGVAFLGLEGFSGMGVIQAGSLVRLFNMKPIGEVVFYGFPDNLIIDSMGVGKIPTVEIYYAKTGDFGISVFTTMMRQQYIDSLVNRERNMLLSALLYAMKLMDSRFLITVDCINMANKNGKAYLIVNSSKLVERFRNREEYSIIERRRVRNSLTLAVAMARFLKIPAVQLILPIQELTESRVQQCLQHMVSLIKDAFTFIEKAEERN
jgi:predicted ATP-grasp superfamily ATP-dependent carboligase